MQKNKIKNKQKELFPEKVENHLKLTLQKINNKHSNKTSINQINNSNKNINRNKLKKSKNMIMVSLPIWKVNK
jgi:hypothetical protein